MLQILFIIVASGLATYDGNRLPIDSPENLIKSLQTAANACDCRSISQLFTDSFASELLKVVRLQDELSAAHTELDKRERSRFGDAAGIENPEVVIRIASTEERHKCLKAVLEIENMKDKSDPDRIVLRVTEKDDVGNRWFRELIATRQNGQWRLVPPSELYQQFIVQRKVKALEAMLQSYRNMARDIDEGKLATRADVDKAKLTAAEEYIKAIGESSRLRNVRLTGSPPVRLLGLGYDEVVITRTTRIRLIKGGLPKDNRPSELWTQLSIKDAENRIPDLKSPDAKIRASAANELGKIGPQAQVAVPALTQLLEDQEISVAEAALSAILKISR